MSPDVVIEVDRVRKTFVQRRRIDWRRLRRERVALHAVADVTFTVRTGEIVGYLGPNGAGVSTPIRILIGVLTPSAGWLRVAGLDRAPAARAGPSDRRRVPPASRWSPAR